jgi:hypothetical protein
VSGDDDILEINKAAPYDADIAALLEADGQKKI